MWFSFWRSRNRFSLDELKHLNDQLQKIQFVNNTNKDFVIETLRSIAELVTYGDQHDPSLFEFFMEKQVMAQLVRILKISNSARVAIQLLQTLSIMIQNLQSEHAIYYLFSNEHVNNLIQYPFDLDNEELLEYYVSFLRAISGRLNKNTISLLVKTQNDVVVSFPLYSEAIKFVHHKENMVRIAARALTLTIYHVSDECVHQFITSPPVVGYFLDLVKFLRQQCLKINALVVDAVKIPDLSQITRELHVAAEEIGDNLHYCNDIICAGVPNLNIIMTHHLLYSLILPVLLPLLHSSSTTGMQMSACTSLFLLSIVLEVVNSKELVNTIGAALLYPPMVFSSRLGFECNGHESAGDLSVRHSTNSTLSEKSAKDQKLSAREILLSYVNCENDKLVLGSLSMLVTLLQSKEIDDSVLDALGILPQKKQHKKILLQTLMGNKSDEEQLFSSSPIGVKEDVYNELETCLQNLKCFLPCILQGQYCLPISNSDQGICSETHRFQVLDALITLLCHKQPLATNVLQHAAWLLQQLLPNQEQKLSDHHFHLLDDAYKKSIANILKEVKDCWCDLIPTVLADELKNCKKAIQMPALQKGPEYFVLPDRQPNFPDVAGDYYSFIAGERMRDAVKVFALHHYLRISIDGGGLHESPQLGILKDYTMNSRARRASLDTTIPKIGSELNLDDALPCRIAFERGKERHFYFLAMAKGTYGCLLLAEEVPLKPHHGVIRIMAPLAGSNPKTDEKHPNWLHVRIRPFNLPFMESGKVGSSTGRSKLKGLVDGRWTLAFPDQQSCMAAKAAILEEMAMQSSAVKKELEPLLNYHTDTSRQKASFCIGTFPER